jgi:predicted dehydrogenase
VQKRIKNIFCEKPFVLNENYAKNLIHLTNSLDSKIFIGQSYRYFNHIKFIRDYACKEKLKSFLIEYHKKIEKIIPLDGWRSEYKEYIIEENGTHLVDLLRFITNSDISYVNAVATNTSNKIKGYDFASLNIRLNNGAIGNIILNNNSQDKETLFSGDHHYFFNTFSLHLSEKTLKTIIYNGEERKIMKNIKDDWHNAFSKMWESCLKNIKENKNPIINPKNNYNTISTICKSIISARRNNKK